MRSLLTAIAGVGVLGLSSTLTGCATPDAPARLPAQSPAALKAQSAPAGGSNPRPTGSGVVQASATAPAPAAPPSSVRPRTFTPEDAVRFALENNPSLQAVREQRGFAQGGLVIAKTYPYNPVAQAQLSGATGPGVTNPLVQSYKVTLDVELRGQRRFRQQAAYAAITRTDWDIVTQELAVAVAANRAFNTLLYRQRKLEVLEETITLNEQVVEQVKKLVDLTKLRPADLVVARTELDAAAAQLGQGRTAIAQARADLRRQFGTLDDSFTVKGELDLPVPTTALESLSEAALEKRPDLQSRRVAVAEAQARLGLQVADRFGNPNVGPAFDYNETKNAFYGAQVSVPLPAFNQKRGEILQARATVAQEAAAVRQYEVQTAQEVQAALARLTEARKWADRYSAEVLPNLQKAVKDMNNLLEQNDPGVDVLKVIGVQRNYLTAYSGYLDALYEVSQARADLAAAVGDPCLAVGLYAPVEPTQPPARNPHDPAPAKDNP